MWCGSEYRQNWIFEQHAADGRKPLLQTQVEMLKHSDILGNTRVEWIRKFVSGEFSIVFPLKGLVPSLAEKLRP